MGHIRRVPGSGVEHGAAVQIAPGAQVVAAIGPTPQMFLRSRVAVPQVEQLPPRTDFSALLKG